MISLFFLKIEIIEETVVRKTRKLLTNVPRPEPVNSRHSKQDITEHQKAEKTLSVLLQRVVNFLRESQNILCGHF